MKYTKAQKANIRAHWNHLELKFDKDGKVMARPGRCYAWALLYTQRQAEEHLKAVGLL